MPTATKTAVKTCRLLYYGPVGVGKRENLNVIHRTIPPEARLSVPVEDPERQIAFQFRRPGEEPWQVLVHAIDAGRERPRLPGTEARPPFDAIVFAVDSGAAHLDQSLAAFESLKLYLDSWGLDLMDVPVVMQYNRRGAPDALPVDRLESLLNPWGMLSFPADSARGEGVRETLKSILGLAINHLGSRPAQVQAAPVAPAPARAAAPSLQVEYGPPVPGAGIAPETAARSKAILNELSPPVVVPVRIPRRLVEGKGVLRVLLEVELTDDDSY
ncbi:MAG TPA: hypothetical protein PLQ13_07275 [Candidatus Krumholzibacteria bacterium]|nr:hypothetical protein [Candidatus Krumholzibacteria bacterium]